MEHFADRLVEAIRVKNSRLCVGLDPRPESMPHELKRRIAGDVERAGKAVIDYGAEVIDRVRESAVAVKLQSACFERLGPFGAPAFFAISHTARQAGLLVIADVKRGDIPSTAEHYAEAYYGPYHADAVTVNPLFGRESVEPFIKRGAVFVIVRPSNPGSSEFLDLRVDGVPVYEKLAAAVAAWGSDTVGASGYSTVGAVVSGRHPEEAAVLRRLMPRTFFLCPGFGAQGGDAASVRACFQAGGLGALVTSSRGIIEAYAQEKYRARFGPDQWEPAIEAAARDARDQINAVAG
jgi:orotidine-5'-phosphate decarboxylase